jgi:hypothetical protein
MAGPMLPAIRHRANSSAFRARGETPLHGWKSRLFNNLEELSCRSDPIAQIEPALPAAVMVVLVERGGAMIATRPDTAFCFLFASSLLPWANSGASDGPPPAKPFQEKFL